MNLSAFEHMKGNVSFYYESLSSDKRLGYNENFSHVAASVIKLPIMVEAFRQITQEGLDENTLFTIRPENKMPSCGVLSYLHDGATLPLIDLVTLMLIVSDNTATNMLIDFLTPQKINHTIDAFNLTGTRLNRKLFEPELSRQGIQNYVSAADCATLLRGIYTGTLISKAADAKMLDILTRQQLNGKMPFHIHCNGIKCAHKTGEDDGITHDVGIVLTKQPFIACYLSSETDVPSFERLIADTTLALTEI